MSIRRFGFTLGPLSYGIGAGIERRNGSLRPSALPTSMNIGGGLGPCFKPQRQELTRRRSSSLPGLEPLSLQGKALAEVCPSSPDAVSPPDCRQPLFLDADVSIGLAVEEAMRVQDLAFGNGAGAPNLSRPRTPSVSSISSVSTIDSCCPCCSAWPSPPAAVVLPAVVSSPAAFAAAVSPTANAPPVPRVSFTFLSEPRLPPVNSPIKDRTNIVQGSPFAAPSQQTKKRRRRAPKEGEPTQQAKRLKKNPPVRDTS